MQRTDDENNIQKCHWQFNPMLDFMKPQFANANGNFCHHNGNRTRLNRALGKMGACYLFTKSDGEEIFAQYKDWGN